MKAQLRESMEAAGHTVGDLGPQTADSVDYPDFAHRLAQKIADGEAERGILVCGTGVGMSIAANRHRGVRAACCSDELSVRMSRLHNDANVLCLGARIVGPGTAESLLEAFLGSSFEGGRHTRRVRKIDLSKSDQD